MVRNFHEDLKSIWLFVDIAEGFVVVFVGFVLLLGEFFHSSIPFPFYFVKGLVDLSFDSSLFAGIVVLLLPFPLIFGDFSIGGRRCGGRGGEGRDGFSVFESSLIWDSDREWWWGWGLLFDGSLGSAIRPE